MKCHSTTLISRMIRAGLKVSPYCTYRVIAAGIDYRGRIIDIATNSPGTVNRGIRGLHAEEKLMRRAPKSLRRVIIIRVNSLGDLLPIDPCKVCDSIARGRGVSIITVCI